MISLGLLVLVIAFVTAGVVTVVRRRRREWRQVVDPAEQQRLRGLQRIGGRL